MKKGSSVDGIILDEAVNVDDETYVYLQKRDDDTLYIPAKTFRDYTGFEYCKKVTFIEKHRAFFKGWILFQLKVSIGACAVIGILSMLRIMVW